MKSTVQSRAPLPLLLVFLLLTGTFGACSDGPDRQGGAEFYEGVDSADTKLVTYHPILDNDVRAGDSLVLDLARLVKAGIVLDGDMPMIGGWVRERGGMEAADTALTDMTYRELLDAALLLDLSDGITPCDNCTDSLVITLPKSRARLFGGMSNRPLDTIIADAYAETLNTDFTAESPWDQIVDTTMWPELAETIDANDDEEYDVILYRLVVERLLEADRLPDNLTLAALRTTVNHLRNDPDATPLISALASLTTTPETTPANN